MPPRVWLPLFVLAGLLLARASAASEFEDKRFQLTPFAGWTFFDKELQAPRGPYNNDLQLGGRLSMRIRSPLWLDLAGGYTKTEACDCNPTWTHLSANLLLVSSTPRMISPFVSLGGGVSKMVPQFGLDRTNKTFEAAAGARIKLTDALGLRLEARNVLLLQKHSYAKSHLDNIVAGAGLVFAFGGKSDAVAQEEPAAAPVVEPVAVVVDRDSDGDGVIDRLDKCPDTPAGVKVDKDGCPISQREVELLDTGRIQLTNVEFDYDESGIRPDGHAVLDSVGALLTKWPGLNIEIDGHTDSRGTDEYNLPLSDRRGEAVRAYLLARFPQFTPAQLSVKAFGETQPLATNDSAVGMQTNRRVEFIVLNRETLKGK